MKRKIMALVCSLTLVLSVAAPVMAEESSGQNNASASQTALSESGAQPLFTDVSSTAWYYDACQYVGQKGIFNGMGDGTFAPQKQMTLAMFMQALANNTENYEKGTYAGEDSDAWYDDAMNWAISVGLIGGADLSAAAQPVQREWIAELMYRYAEAAGCLDMEAQSGSFDDLASYYQDASQISASAADAVLWCAQRGLMQGDSGLFRPDGILTRAQTAQLFQNADARTSFFSGSGPDSSGNSVVYMNREMGFSVEFPDTWKNRYKVRVNPGDSSSLVIEVSEWGGTLGFISRETVKEWTESGKGELIPVPYRVLAENSEYVYILYFPSDANYDVEDEEQVDTYQEMTDDLYNNIKFEILAQ